MSKEIEAWSRTREGKGNVPSAIEKARKRGIVPRGHDNEMQGWNTTVH